MQFAAVIVLIVISIKLSNIPDSLNNLHDHLGSLGAIQSISNGLFKINDSLEHVKCLQ